MKHNKEIEREKERRNEKTTHEPKETQLVVFSPFLLSDRFSLSVCLSFIPLQN